MELNELRPELIVGIEQIDNEHRRQFSALYAIHRALIEKKESSELAQMFHDLVSSIDESIEAEEELFHETDYPMASDHAAAHEELSVAMMKKDWEFANGKTPITDEALRGVTRDLGDHIIAFDKLLGQVLREKPGKQ